MQVASGCGSARFNENAGSPTESRVSAHPHGYHDGAARHSSDAGSGAGTRRTSFTRGELIKFNTIQVMNNCICRLKSKRCSFYPT